jgi:hypothetical protein
MANNKLNEAGFIEKSGSGNIFGSLGKGIRALANLGMQYEDMVIKQSRGVGVTEAEFGNSGYLPQEFLYSLAMSDIGQKKFIAYFEKDYKSRRDYLRRFAMNGEIDYIVETIADESIVYDEKNFFCLPDTSTLGEYLDDEKTKEIKDSIDDSFKKIYSAFSFKDSHDAWHFFKKFLIDGFLSFEIIFDKKGKEVIGFKELDAMSLRPGVQKMDDGTFKKIWVQYEDVPSLKRELLDSQIIYISYAKGNFVGRLSYVERLVRSFNLLRIMENSRIIWNVMNSSYRLKMVVPIGTKSPQKAKESLAEMLAIYKEDVSLDFDSGELTINGKPTMQFYKNYLFPSKNGEQPDIEVMGGEGPDLSDTDALKYFYDKLRMDSKVPFNRFDFENPGQANFDAGGMDRDEIRFGKFVNRLRTMFQELLLKPMWVQMSLSHPELAEDHLIKANLGLKFNTDNIFEEAKTMELNEKRANFIQTMQGITVPEMDDTGMMNDVPYFNAKFLITKYMKLSPSDIRVNEKMQAKKAEEDAKKAKEAGGGDDF